MVLGPRCVHGSSHIAPCQECERTEYRQLHLEGNVNKITKYRQLLRTIYTFAELDDLPELHSLVLLGGEVGQDTRAEVDIFVEIAFSEPIPAEL